MVRLRTVSTGMRECVDYASKIILEQRKHATAYYFQFVERHFSKTLLKAAMLDRYKDVMKQGLGKVSEHSLFTCNEAYMSVLVFYLRMRCPRHLKKMLHCIVPKWCPFNRRLFRRVYLKVEMYLMRIQNKCSRKGSINCKTTWYQSNRKQRMSKNVSTSNKSVTIKTIPEDNETLPTLVLTEERLHMHNTSQRKRRREHPSREKKKVKRYSEEFQQNVEVQDDFQDDPHDDVESTSSAHDTTGIEQRSVDSQSEGSLKDFIVNSEDEEEDCGTKLTEEEDELSDRETDEESLHTSDMSGVYSDEEEDNE